MEIKPDKENPQSLRDFAESWERVGRARGEREASEKYLTVIAILIDQLGGEVEISDLEKLNAARVNIECTENYQNMSTRYRTKPQFKVK